MIQKKLEKFYQIDRCIDTFDYCILKGQIINTNSQNIDDVTNSIINLVF